jgi:hypothetical protein
MHYSHAIESCFGKGTYYGPGSGRTPSPSRWERETGDEVRKYKDLVAGDNAIRSRIDVHLKSIDGAISTLPVEFSFKTMKYERRGLSELERKIEALKEELDVSRTRVAEAFESLRKKGVDPHTFSCPNF